MSLKAAKILESLRDLKILMDLSDDIEQVERRFWVNNFLAKREEHSLETFLLKDLLWEDSEYNNFCRMNINDFEKVLALVSRNVLGFQQIFMASIATIYLVLKRVYILSLSFCGKVC